jgi:adenine phosphoribosyltransferase
MTPHAEKRALQGEPGRDREKIESPETKTPRTQGQKSAHDCGEKADVGKNEKLPVHQSPQLRRTARRWQTCTAAVDVLPAPVSIAAMGSEMLEKLRAGVRDVPDFPKKGIVFKDITPILSDGALFRTSIDVFLEHCRGKKIDKIVGIDARGFLFGSAVAYELGVGFVPIRKRGKLPFKTEIAKYSLEYGEAEMEMHIDAMEPGEKIVLVDDLLATGGTSAAAAALIAKIGGELTDAIFLIELAFLNGREKLAPTPVTSFIKY